MAAFHLIIYGRFWVITEGKVLWIDNSGIRWVYAPLFWSVAAVVICHLIGIRANQAVSQKLRTAYRNTVRTPLYGNLISAARVNSISGVYALLPLPGFAGTTMLTLWVFGIFLFANVHTNPFIYFQF